MDVILAIKVVDLAVGETITTAVAILASLGGQLVGWQPEINGAPIRAWFAVEGEAERALFVTGALKISGVSLAVWRSN